MRQLFVINFSRLKFERKVRRRARRAVSARRQRTIVPAPCRRAELRYDAKRRRRRDGRVFAAKLSNSGNSFYSACRRSFLAFTIQVYCVSGVYGFLLSSLLLLLLLSPSSYECVPNIKKKTLKIKYISCCPFRSTRPT